ncbi:hypothetical protein ACXYMO_16940 [Arenibacterium sp. CAU 1754]
MTGSDISYALAGPGDFGDIERLLAQTDMPGWITLSYRSDLSRARVMSPAGSVQSVIGRNDRGTLAGMASRMVLPGYWNGQPRAIGWAAQLRLAHAFRHRPSVLRGGFDAFRRDLHDPQETPWYMASILSENRVAKRLLERGLPGFPTFTPVARLHTLAFSAQHASGSDAIRCATPGDAPALRAFLNRENRLRPLAPALDETEDFSPNRWPGLSIGDFLIAERSGEITGATALWSQDPYRCLVVTGYNPWLARARPLVNLVSPLTGLPKLPPFGAALPMAYLAFFTVAGNDATCALALLRAARAEARARQFSFVSLGLVQDDPLWPTLSALRHRDYGATLYTVTWKDGEIAPPPEQFHLAKVELSLL